MERPTPKCSAFLHADLKQLTKKWHKNVAFIDKMLSNKLEKQCISLSWETLADGMETQRNYFVANHQPACDSHSTWRERTALSVNEQTAWAW